MLDIYILYLIGILSCVFLLVNVMIFWLLKKLLEAIERFESDINL